MHRTIFCLLLLFPLRLFADDPEFIGIFDGKTLDGWHAGDPSYWSVEDGAITGRITPEHPCTVNQYLVWEGGELADFELKLESRLNGEGAINNGFQFRSRELPDHDVCGYQMDNNLQTPWLVRLYDEYGRHDLALRGERATFDVAGVRTVVPLPEGSGEPWFKLEDWHEYHLTCIAGKITLRVNGRMAAEIEDHDPRRAEPQGILALQLHSGPTTEVQFRNIRLKVLKTATTVKTLPTQAEMDRTKVFSTALAHWELDSAGRGANPKLISNPQFYQLELNVLSTGTGARPGDKCVVLDGAYFETDSILPLDTTAFTLYIRATRPNNQGPDPQILISKESDNVSNEFNLAYSSQGGEDSSGQHSSSLTFTFRTTEGHLVQYACPLSVKNRQEWHDIVVRHDGQMLDIFVDKLPAKSTRTPSPIAIPAAPLRIGATRDEGQPVHQVRGDMETVAIWDRALSENDVDGLTLRP